MRRRKKRKSQTRLQRPLGHYHTSLTHIGHSGRGGLPGFARSRRILRAAEKPVLHLSRKSNTSPCPGQKRGPLRFFPTKAHRVSRKSKNGRATKRHHSRKDCVHEATSRVDVVERLLRFLTDAPEDETRVTKNGRNAAAITGRASPCKSDGGIESWQGGAEGGGTVR